jgi:hypothetical protein
MAQILLSARDKLAGKLFSSVRTDISIPYFTFVRLRERLGPSDDTEIDIHGGAGIEQWVAESKWIAGRKVGVKDIKLLLNKAELVQKDRDASIVRTWFFGNDGFTPDAEKLMQQKGVFWSTRKDLDELLKLMNLRKLPEL